MKPTNKTTFSFPWFFDDMLFCRHPTASFMNYFNRWLTKLVHIFDRNGPGAYAGLATIQRERWKMSNMRMILLEAALVAGVLMTGLSVSQVTHAAPPAAAADPRVDVKIDSVIMVERTEESKSGETVTKLFKPGAVKVVPGDRLLFTNSYHNLGQDEVTGFVVNNAVPKSVTFVELLDNWAMVSVDGGKNFGKLSDLSVTDAEQESRPAIAADVTHIRWVLSSPIAPGASGELSFRGTVE